VWEKPPFKGLKQLRVGEIPNSMKLTAQIRLNPTQEQAAILLETMETANAACNAISDYAWETKTFTAFKLHRAVYHETRQRFPLSAQVVVRCLGKVADTYKSDKKRKHEFRARGAVVYDSRILKHYTDRQEVSIWTLDGRARIPYSVGGPHARMLEHQRGESDLVYRRGMFFLLATCDVPEDDRALVDDVLGIDLGIVEIATDSTGESFNGLLVEAKRQWYAGRRAILQSVGTRSAKCHLKRLAGKEKRFRADVNHCISKHLVKKAKDTGCAIALEDLSGIRDRVTVRRAQRARHHSWSFFQLRAFLAYKAILAGVPVVLVDPRNTSRTCHKCGHCEKKNRKSQSEFVCRSCGHSAGADFNAACNIAARGVVNLPMVSSLAA